MHSHAQAARAYFDELYKAGGLDRVSGQYVCFSDDQALNTFFIFGKSSSLRQFLIDVGGYAKLPLAERRLLDKGFLYVKPYDRGVPLGERSTFEADGDTWLLEGLKLDAKTKAKLRIAISWQTLRYKRTIDISQNGGSYTEAAANYGKCQEMPPGVDQKGN